MRAVATPGVKDSPTLLRATRYPPTIPPAVWITMKGMRSQLHRSMRPPHPRPGAPREKAITWSMRRFMPRATTPPARYSLTLLAESPKPYPLLIGVKKGDGGLLSL